MMISRKKNKIDRKEFGNTLIISLSFSCTMLLGAPFEIYLTNVKDFLCILVAFLFLKHFLQKGYYYLVALISYLFWGFYIQGNYIKNQNGVMDGHIIDWSRLSVERILSALLWVLLLAVIIVIITAKKTTIDIIAIYYPPIFYCFENTEYTHLKR